ncbi:TIGR03757 family integrating conjugative element protein [Pseudomonas aeruginosa]|nr:TIGR03757 family integrating conjugative element protein [Pseudomonas aeruginosa]NBK54249.1 TIGR03757 family integrating conjugative element protein [Pseudomonas aeruginosa]
MNPSPSIPSFRQASICLSVLALFAALVFSSAQAADVITFTDAQHPVSNWGGARVVLLDAPAGLEASLNAQLPADPTQAEAIVRQRLAQGGAGLQQQLAAAYQGVADAWGLGIAKIPAVVVDRRFVIYGDLDVAHAVARINAYRSARP